MPDPDRPLPEDVAAVELDDLDEELEQLCQAIVVVTPNLSRACDRPTTGAFLVEYLPGRQAWLALCEEHAPAEAEDLGE